MDVVVWAGRCRRVRPDHGQRQLFSRDSACARYLWVKKLGDHVSSSPVPLRFPIWRGAPLPGKPHTCHSSSSRHRGAWPGREDTPTLVTQQRASPKPWREVVLQEGAPGGWLKACPSDADITGRGALLVRQ